MIQTGIAVGVNAAGAKAGASAANSAFMSMPPAAQRASQAVANALRSIPQHLSQIPAAAGRAAQGITKAFSSVKSAAFSLQGAIASLGAAFAFKQLIDFGLQFNTVHNTMEAAAGSAEMAAGEYKFLRSEVDRLGLDLLKTAPSFAQLMAAAKETQMQGSKLRDTFTAIVEASTALHLSGEKTADVINAVQQMMSKGTVQMQELKLQLGNNLPGAMLLAQKATGKTGKEFNKLMEEGKILTDEFLPKFAKLLHEEYGDAAVKAGNSTQGLLNRFRTAFTDIVNLINQAGVMDEFNNLLKEATEILKTEDFKKFAIGLGEIIAKVIRGTTNLLNLLRQAGPAFKAAFGVELWDTINVGARTLWATFKELVNITITWGKSLFDVLAGSLDISKNLFVIIGKAMTGDIQGAIKAAFDAAATSKDTWAKLKENFKKDWVGDALAPLMQGFGDISSKILASRVKAKNVPDLPPKPAGAPEMSKEEKKAADTIADLQAKIEAEKNLQKVIGLGEAALRRANAENEAADLIRKAGISSTSKQADAIRKLTLELEDAKAMTKSLTEQEKLRTEARKEAKDMSADLKRETEALNKLTAARAQGQDAFLQEEAAQKVGNALKEKASFLTKQEIDDLTALEFARLKAQEALDKANKAYEDGKQILEAYMDPMKRYLDIIRRINEAVAQTPGIEAEAAKARHEAAMQLERDKVDELRRMATEAQELRNLRIETADLQVQMGQFSGMDFVTSVFGDFITDFRGTMAGLSDIFSQTFSTIADGAAESLGRALVYAENLGEAMKNVAREAIAQLISGFIKLGIQWLVTALLGKALSTTAVAFSAAQAAVLAAAWAPAAAFASLATLGSNAIPAAAALTGTTALAEMLGITTSAVAGSGSFLAAGGYVSGAGTSTSDSIPAMLSNGEFVMRAAAVKQIGVPTLERLNRGGMATTPTSGRGGLAPAVNVYVEHDGSTAVSVQRTSENEMRIIARQAVEEHAPRVVAADMQNPNSRTSKAVGRNVVAPRRR